MNSFKTGRKRTIAMYLTFGGIIILALLFIVFLFNDIALIEKLRDGKWVSDSKLETSDDRLSTVRFLQFSLMIIPAILTLTWIHLAFSNLSSLEAKEFKFSPGWAVGWFFIPILNTFRPYQAMTEIWKVSSSETNILDTGTSKRERFPLLVVFWWALYLVAWCARVITDFIITPEEPASFTTLAYKSYQGYLDDLILHRYALLITEVIIIAGIAATVLLVMNISRNQKRKYALINGSDP